MQAYLRYTFVLLLCLVFLSQAYYTNPIETNLSRPIIRSKDSNSYAVSDKEAVALSRIRLHSHQIPFHPSPAPVLPPSHPTSVNDHLEVKPGGKDKKYHLLVKFNLAIDGGAATYLLGAVSIPTIILSIISIVESFIRLHDWLVKAQETTNTGTNGKNESWVRRASEVVMGWVLNLTVGILGEERLKNGVARLDRRRRAMIAAEIEDEESRLCCDSPIESGINVRDNLMSGKLTPTPIKRTSSLAVSGANVERLGRPTTPAPLVPYQ